MTVKLYNIVLKRPHLHPNRFLSTGKTDSSGPQKFYVSLRPANMLYRAREFIEALTNGQVGNQEFIREPIGNKEGHQIQ